MSHSSYQMSICGEDDIFLAIGAAKRLMKQHPFTPSDKQKVMVCVAELTRNILIHAHSIGMFSCHLTDHGISFQVMDHGPGILCVTDILSGKRIDSVTGLGLGLAGAKRMMDQLIIRTSAQGTAIHAEKWVSVPSYMPHVFPFIPLSPAWRKDLQNGQ